MAGWHLWCNGRELGQTWEMVRDREAWQSMGLQRVGQDCAAEQQQTEKKKKKCARSLSWITILKNKRK